MLCPSLHWHNGGEWKTEELPSTIMHEATHIKIETDDNHVGGNCKLPGGAKCVFRGLGGRYDKMILSDATKYESIDFDSDEQAAVDSVKNSIQGQLSAIYGPSISELNTQDLLYDAYAWEEFLTYAPANLGQHNAIEEAMQENDASTKESQTRLNELNEVAQKQQELEAKQAELENKRAEIDESTRTLQEIQQDVDDGVDGAQERLDAALAEGNGDLLAMTEALRATVEVMEDDLHRLPRYTGDNEELRQDIRVTGQSIQRLQEQLPQLQAFKEKEEAAAADEESAFQPRSSPGEVIWSWSIFK